MNNSPLNALPIPAVRLSINHQLIGSGFIVVSADPEILYVLTARHCLDEYDGQQPLMIDFFDFTTSCFNLSIPARQWLFGATDKSYDVAIHPIPRNSIPLAIESVILLPSIPKKQKATFTGFPVLFSGKKPKEVDVTTSIPIGATTVLKTVEQFESNDSISAEENAKGLSGSGLILERGGQVELVGIVTHYNATYNEFTAYNLAGVNDILENYKLPLLPLGESHIEAKAPIADTDFILQIRATIRSADDHWVNLHPKQALLVVQTALQSVVDSNLPATDRNPLLANLYYIKALAEFDLGLIDADMYHSGLIRAYKLHQEKQVYRERAALAYLKKDQFSEAMNLAESLLEEDEENPRAWLVYSALRPDREVPASVKAKPVYKVGIVPTLKLGDTQLNVQMLAPVFRDEIENRPLPNQIDRYSIYYWHYLSQTAMITSLVRHGQLLIEEKVKWIRHDPLQAYARDLFEKICTQVAGTDFQERELFQLARLDFCKCQYYLTDDPEQEQLMVNDLFELFVGNIHSSRPRFLHRTPVFATMPSRLVELLAIFLQQNRPQFVIDTMNRMDLPKDPVSYVMLGFAYAKRGDVANMTNAFKTYASHLSIVDTQVTIYYISILQAFMRLHQKQAEILDWLLDGKSFTETYLEQLIRLFFWAEAGTNKPFVKAEAEKMLVHWDQLPVELQRPVAAIFSEMEEWATAKQLWQALMGDGMHESEELRMYLTILFEENREPIELKDRLDYWRRHLTPNPGLVRIELELYRRLEKYDKIIEVALFGLNHFPDSIHFWFHCIHAYFRLDNQVALTPLLDERVLSDDLPVNLRFYIAYIYLRSGVTRLGVDAAYRTLKQLWPKQSVRKKYYDLVCQFEDTLAQIVFQSAELDCVVLVEAEGKQLWVELTTETLTYNDIATQVKGLQVGQTFTTNQSITNAPVTYRVVQIINKYLGQLAIILDKESKNPQPNSPFHIIEMDNPDNPQELLDKLDLLLGPQQQKRQEQIAEIIQKFENAEIGLFEFAQSVFTGNPLGAWEHATADSTNGFTVFPLEQLRKQLPPLILTNDTEFVLDLSSLLTLFQVAKSTRLGYRGKPFIVSQFTIDFVANELELISNREESGFGFGYRVNQFVPVFHPEDFQQRRIQYWTSLKQWIKQNCQADYSWERLTFKRTGESGKDLFSEANRYKASWIDSLLLASKPNRFLLTDDLFHFTRVPFQGIRVTTEWYLRTIHPTLYKQSYWLELLQLNMRGLTLTGEQLFLTFTSNDSIDSARVLYGKAVQSFTYRYNFTFNNLLELLNFIKQLLALKLLKPPKSSFDYKREIIRSLFQQIFTTPLPKRVETYLLNQIDIEFQQFGKVIQKDLLQILRNLRSPSN